MIHYLRKVVQWDSLSTPDREVPGSNRTPRPDIGTQPSCEAPRDLRIKKDKTQ